MTITLPAWGLAIIIAGVTVFCVLAFLFFVGWMFARK